MTNRAPIARVIYIRVNIKKKKKGKDMARVFIGVLSGLIQHAKLAL